MARALPSPDAGNPQDDAEPALRARMRHVEHRAPGEDAQLPVVDSRFFPAPMRGSHGNIIQLRKTEIDRRGDQPLGGGESVGRRTFLNGAAALGTLAAFRAMAEVCRKHALSPATFYKLKAKYGGLEVSDARRLRQLEDENGKLKRLLGEGVLDNAILKDLVGKV